MKLFTANQVNQVYVVKSLKTDTVNSETGAVTAKAQLTNEGDIKVNKTPNGEIYFTYKGAGGLVRSDLIKPENILYTKVTTADQMQRKLRVATVTINSDVQAGKDYILRVTFKRLFSLADDDFYWKYGVARGASSMTGTNGKATLTKMLAVNLVKSLAREENSLITVKYGNTEVTPTTKVSDLTGNGTTITITEVQQDWILGLKQDKPVEFEVSLTPIDEDFNAEYDAATRTSTFDWGTVVYSDGDTIKNGRLMADYEYFWHGEQGDLYRMSGWPNYIPTKYLVDPTAEYDTIAIHFAFVDANEGVQKSERDLTLICTPSVTDSVKNAFEALLK